MAQNKKPIAVVLGAGSFTNDTFSGVFDGEGADDIIVYLTLAVVTSGSCVIQLQSSPDKGGSWFNIQAPSSSLSVAGNYTLTLKSPFGKYSRVAILGTYAMAFGISVETCKIGN